MFDFLPSRGIYVIYFMPWHTFDCSVNSIFLISLSCTITCFETTMGSMTAFFRVNVGLISLVWNSCEVYIQFWEIQVGDVDFIIE